MPLNKAQKQIIIENLKEKISKQKAIVFVGITGLKVKEFSELRKKVKEIGGSIQVVKKTLADLAFKANKLDFDKKNFKEEFALIFGFQDEILPAKTAYQFSKGNEKLKILGGFIENQFQASQDMIALAKLPGRSELLARLVGSVSAPPANFVNVLAANLRNLVYILSQIKPSA